MKVETNNNSNEIKPDDVIYFGVDVGLEPDQTVESLVCWIERDNCFVIVNVA
jgi:hypothetical protein